MSQLKKAIDTCGEQIDGLYDEMERYLSTAEQVDEVELIKRRMEVANARSHELTEMANDQAAMFRGNRRHQEGGSMTTTTTDYTDITDAEIAALYAIDGGSDILSSGFAVSLRAVQSRHPELLIIGKAMGKYGVRESRPYFGAMLTAKGRTMLKERAPGMFHGREG